MNTVERLAARHRVKRALRQCFEAQGFVEVDPPTLVPFPGMEPHITAVEVQVDLGSGPLKRYLHTSPEFHMKRLLAQGAQRIYAMTPVFRAGEHGVHHRTEFTMLEWYRAHESYDALMVDCELLISSAARAIQGSTQVGGLDLSPPYSRLTLAQAFECYAGVDLLRYVEPLDGVGLQNAARQAGLHAVAQPQEQGLEAFERAFYEVMLARVEPGMAAEKKPTFLTQWPLPLAALSQVCAHDARVAERVELYAAGLELGNGFGELTVAAEQERRFVEEQQRRAHLGKPVYGLDRAFLDALQHMPPACGMAVGLDRVVLLACGQQDLAQVQAV